MQFALRTFEEFGEEVEKIINNPIGYDWGFTADSIYFLAENNGFFEKCKGDKRYFYKCEKILDWEIADQGLLYFDLLFKDLNPQKGTVWIITGDCFFDENISGKAFVVNLIDIELFAEKYYPGSSRFFQPFNCFYVFAKEKIVMILCQNGYLWQYRYLK